MCQVLKHIEREKYRRTFEVFNMLRSLMTVGIPLANVMDRSAPSASSEGCSS